MGKPHQSIDWGTGDLGGVALREIGGLLELQLVALRTRTETKICRDAGEARRFNPLRVVATNDAETQPATDRALFTPREVDNHNPDNSSSVQLKMIGACNAR